MLIKKPMGIEVPSSEITPYHHYVNRRQFMKGLAGLAAGSLLAACRPEPPASLADPAIAGAESGGGAGTAGGATPASELVTATDELGDPLNAFREITNYNNYYEFTVDKEGVAKKAENFRSSPWQIEVGGLVSKPGIYDLDDLRRFDQEERIYRLRCVEAWSMVIPWLGFPLRRLLEAVEPKAEAKFVRFETLYDPDQMPGQRSPWYDWPYVEGLRMDEAMHDLTLMATGLYGQDLLPQNGAPVRLVVPWKYGFKSIKSIVKIELVDVRPRSLWMKAAPDEYGFFANVNPAVNHPRWSQASERRIGETGRRPTLMFNGYEAQVAELYAGMDLAKNY